MALKKSELYGSLPVPSHAEQDAIASILTGLDAEIDAIETKLAKACALKQGMTPQLLTGRLHLV